MKTIKDIARKIITKDNYKEDSIILVKMIYKKYGVDLKKISALNIVDGSKTTPKLMSVLRRVQMEKKLIDQKVKKINKSI